MSNDLDQDFNRESNPQLVEFIQQLNAFKDEQKQELESAQKLVESVTGIDGAHVISYNTGDAHSRWLGADAMPHVPGLNVKH